MPPHPFDKHWYAHVDGKTYGPYTGHEISRMVEQGKILESDFVFSDDQSAWVRAKDDPILSTLFQRPVTAGLSAPLQRYVTDKLGRRARIAVFTALFAALVGWIAWPYYTLYALMNALREGDTAVIENSIAWDSVRQGLRGDLNAVLLHKLSTDAKPGINEGAFATGLTAVLGPAIINQVVDSYVTPQDVSTLIRTGRPPVDLKGTAALDGKGRNAAQKSHLSIHQLKYAFFSGGPLTFKAELRPEDRKVPLTLLFKWNGDWKLTRIILPADVLEPAGGMDGFAASTSTENAKSTPGPSIPKEPSPLEVTLVNKSFKSANPRGGDYEDDITFELSIRNLTGKDIRAFDGVVTFTDLLDNEVMSSKLAINDPVRADSTMNWKGAIKYNQFMDSHQRLRNATQANLNTNFVVRKILFASGSSKEY